MAVLNSWQKITRVMPGLPFADGADGDYASATIPTLTKRSCSGNSAQANLAIASSGFANGDLVLIIQMRGTGVGQWEINQVLSGGGTTTLTMKKNLHYTYTDSGASQAQVIKIPRYRNVTVQAGTWTIPDWDGDLEGLFIIAFRGTMTITGNATGTGKGYRGGASVSAQHAGGNQGEGSAGAGTSATNAANGSGGGSGTDVHDNSEGGGGGGGGHANAGSNGSDNGGSEKGLGGNQVGSSDLTSILMGGAGASGAAPHNAGNSSGAGGDSGAIIMLFGKHITTAGSVSNNGVNGGNVGAGNAAGAGGGGTGGSTLIVCQTASLGSNLFTATAGNGGTASEGVSPPHGGNGSVGRIAIHHSGTVTGTTNPTFTDVTDRSLKEKFPAVAAILL